MQVYPLLVFRPYVPFHSTVYLVDIDGDLRLDISWVVCLVGLDVANALHVLPALISTRPGHTESHDSYIHLGIVPLIHAQRLDFGDVCSQLAM